MSKEQIEFKQLVARKYADIVCHGFWYTSMHKDLMAYVRSTQSAVTGKVRMRLEKGNIIMLGRKSHLSIYDQDIASYEKFDGFDSNTAIGFIRLHGLETQAQIDKQKNSIFNTPKGLKGVEQ